jgi:hypothetical protein
LAQFMRPVLDVTNQGWTGEDGDTTAIFEHIDDVAANDADYIRTQLSPTNDVYVFKFSPVTDPGVSSGYIIRIRFGKDAPGGDVIDLTFQLRQNYISEASMGILLGETGAGDIPPGWTDFVYAIPGSIVDLITDHTQVYGRFIANSHS